MSTNDELLPILLYIFEHHMRGKKAENLLVEDLLDELEDAGFDRESGHLAIEWMHQILSLHSAEAMHTNTESQSTRVFSELEIHNLSVKVRGYILYLERAGILNAVTRERVISRLMSASEVIIDIKHLQVITLLVLENDPEPNPDALYSMESLMAAQEENRLH